MKAIISGASRGLGKATAIAMAAEGYDLLLISRSENDLKKLQKELEEEHKRLKIEILPIDLSSPDLELNFDLSDEMEEMVLINNVGSYQNEKVSGLKKEEIEKMLSVNLFSSVALTNSILPFLRKCKKAQIVNISSINGLEADPNATAYSISKHSLKAWNDALREELRKENIKVTAFYPGPINTTSWEGADVDHSAMIQAEDIAQMIVQVCKLSLGALVEDVKMNPLNFKLN